MIYDSPGGQPRESTESLIRIGNPPQVPKGIKKRGKLFLAIGLTVGLLLIGIAALVWATLPQLHPSPAASAQPSPLVQAQQKCAPGSPYAIVGDGGKTLILQSRGKEKPGIEMSQLQCVWNELNVSDAVRSEIGATRALDGRRSGDWGEFHASWSYHPDNGVQMTITMK